jgi:glycosyltransferase involved in cell wall biosynthesis
VKRRWTINGRFIAQPGTGVQRYASEIVRSLDRMLTEGPTLAAQLELDILVPPDADELPSLEAIPVRRVGRYGGHSWEQTVLPQHAPGGLLSLCNTGPVVHRRQIVCIHDLNTRTCTESYSFGFRTDYRVVLPMLVRTTTAIHTDSGHSAEGIARAGIRPRSEILVIPNGHDHVARWHPVRSPATHDVAGRNTIVVLGSPAPHKNLGLIIGLGDRLAASNLRVAVVGASDPRVYRGTELLRSENVMWLGRLDDNELAALLQSCLCLAFPSLTEGFGLPPLEAMALGCPVVASNRASIPEVCGDAALYAAPDNPEAWLQHFRALSSSEDLRKILIERGTRQAGQFRWDDSARRYLRAMAIADGSGFSAAA